MTALQQRGIDARLARAYYGMGALGTTDQQIGGALVVSGSALLQSAKYAGPAAPFVAIGGAVLEIAGAITSLFGPNPNNIIASGYVNQIEADIMKPNLQAWQALAPEHKIYSMQQAALANFMAGWNQVLRLCDNPALGSAGVNCIGDRQRGGKWDWWVYYYDPIAKDPQVIPDPAPTVDTGSVPGSAGASVSGAVDNTASSVSGSLGVSPLWLGVGLILAAALVSD